MGKTIDLPDPLEKDAAPLPAPSADELLAQLAGDEIDRLLAEADARPEPPPPIAPPVVAPSIPSSAPPRPPANKLVDPATDPELAMELDSLFQQLHPEPAGPAAPTVPTPVPAPVPSTAVPTDVPAPGQELDAPYNPIGSEQAPSTLSAAAVPAVPPAPASSVESLNPASQTHALEQQVLASDDLMRAAIEAAMPVHADAAVEPAAPPESAAIEPSARRSLNPLVWLSNAFSDATLDALGKVAILTLINALAILLYVVIFRKH